MTTVTGKRVILKNLQDEYLIPFTDQGGSGNPDNETIILNDEDALRAIKVMDQGQQEPYAFREVTAQEYAAMKEAGTLDPHTYYNVPDVDDIVVDVNNKANKSLDNLDAAGEARLGSKRNIGEIITSTIPLTDAGLHLLDGTRLSGDGIYGEFVQYIADLYTENPTANYFTTESAWQTSVTQYGVCGKFVYDSVNNTVRLPKVTGIIEGTTDLSALGDLVEAGLPNIEGSITAPNEWTSEAFYNKGQPYRADTFYGNGRYNEIGFDASRSSSIYGNSTTVQPQTIKAFYYIVIATSTKTDIQVDIDEIATDLNGKADVDLSNCTKPHIVETYVNGNSWYRVYSDGWCEQGGYINTTASNPTFNLLKLFKNTNYTIIACTSRSNICPTRVVSNSQFYADFGYGGSTQQGFWQASGYIN